MMTIPNIQSWVTLADVYLFGFGVGVVWISIAIYIQVVARSPPRAHVWAFYGVGVAITLLGSRVWIPEESFVLWTRLGAFVILLLTAGVFFRYVGKKEQIPPPYGIVRPACRKLIRWLRSRM